MKSLTKEVNLTTSLVVKVEHSVRWVCLFVQTTTFKRNDLSPRYLARWLILTLHD